jgi:hypothetical protein
MVGYYVTCVKAAPATRISIGPFLNLKVAEESAALLRRAKLVDSTEIEEAKYPRDD